MTGLLALSLIASTGAHASVPETVKSYVRAHIATADFPVTRFRYAEADLNEDGQSEAFIYVTEAAFCGSGGCTLYVLTPTAEGWRRVMRSTVTRPPIRILRTSSNGWRDIGVFVAGGGIINGYTARLRFDGAHYPANPSTPPAEQLAGEAGGEILIGR